MWEPSGGWDLTAEPDLYAEPLAYPGTPARGSGLLVNGSYVECASAELEPGLRRLGATGLRDRHPVIAVGSNASPAQLWRKLRGDDGRLVLPITMVEVTGVMAGVSAHVSRSGYLPATPVPVPGQRSTFAVVWLDARRLLALDATEPNYARVSLCDGESSQVTKAQVANGRPFEVYASRHGHMVGPSGAPRPARPQTELIGEVLAESPALRELAGPTPEEFATAMRHTPAARSRARQIFIDERRVRHSEVYRAYRYVAEQSGHTT